MRKPDLPYLEFKTVKGRPYIYFRKSGQKRVRLPDNPDTPEFAEAYWACRSGRNRAPEKETWGNLIDAYLSSPGFMSKALGTRSNYRRHCDAIREKNGNKPVRAFRRKHAIASRDALADTWSKANERLAMLSILCKFAVDLEWIDRNPVADIPKLKGGSYQAWPDEKLRAFERHCDTHELTMTRTIYELSLGTGQRLGDVVQMQWEDFDGEFMHVVQEKTGTQLEVYCPDRLRNYLAALPRQGRYILAKNLTQHISKRRAQKLCEDVRTAIGARAFVQHGWRYNAAKELADADVSDADIQAVTGHRTTAMAQKYRGQANQREASRRAQQKRERNKHRT